MKCVLSNSKDYKKNPGTVRDNKDLAVYECSNCGLVFLSENNHIDNTFYENSNMHNSFDFQKWRNETAQDDKRRFEFGQSIITNKNILDFGSGNGVFLKKAKFNCTEIAGVKLENAVSSYYEKDKLELYKNLDDIKNKKFDVITSFRGIEHIKEPVQILKKSKSLLETNDKLIIEVPNANDALLTIFKNEGFSNFTYWNCHLYLYTHHTLSILAKKAGFKVEFIKHIQRYPLSNHLYCLSNNKPGGHKKWGNFIDSEELNQSYENQLATLQATDTIIACLTKEN